MVLAVIVLVLGVLVGYALGGRLRHLGDLSLRGVWLLLVGLGLQLALTGGVALGVDVGTWAAPTMGASLLAVAAFMLGNVRVPGMALIGAGVLLNAIVIIANGGMPVSPTALEAIGSDATIDPGKHRLLEPGDPFAILADIIPVAALRSVLSIGDVVLAAGVGLTIVATMRRPPGRRVAGATPLLAPRANAPDHDPGSGAATAESPSSGGVGHRTGPPETPGTPR